MKKFFIIRLSSIGDIVLTEPVPRLIKRQYPDSQVFFLTKKIYLELLKANPYIDELIAFERFDRDLIRRIRKTGFDTVIDLHRNPRSYLISLLATKERVIRVDKKRLARWLYVKFKVKPKYKPVIWRYAETLHRIGIEFEDTEVQPQFYLSKHENKKLDELMQGSGLSPDKLFIGMAPGAKWFTKRWPLENYLRLAALLQEKFDCQIAIFGKEDELKHPDLSFKNRPGIIDFTGKLDLSELGVLINRLDFLVTNDTGPMHIAAALKVPLVAIFGTTTPELGFRPSGRESIVIERQLDCRPCALHGRDCCPKRHFRCMVDIKPQEVFEIIIKTIKPRTKTDAHRK